MISRLSTILLVYTQKVGDLVLLDGSFIALLVIFGSILIVGWLFGGGSCVIFMLGLL